MYLEDEFDDIIGKAENGVGKKVNLSNLEEAAKELNLNLKALKNIKNKNYFPKEYDFFKSNELRVVRIQVSFHEGYVNSYLLVKGNKCVIIDTCGSSKAVINKIEQEKLKPEFILLTHGHGDHVNGLKEIEDKYDLKVVKKNHAGFCGHKINRILTPGHTNDSVTFSVENFLFAGDLIFAGSLGGGSYSYEKLLESAKKILSLEEDLWIFPGHGPSTSVKQEKENNAFINFNNF